ncbi:sigma-54-dependent Fis family transcriptional regulator [bacterium]|nr:sigma-54-dependent Fis family transcriptional regulator [bacterium]
MGRILVIDDDQSLRDVVGFILQEAGHEVRCAESGEEGIALFDEDRPDLVLTDMKMPGLDGFDVLRHVMAEANDATVPVIVLTAYGTVEQAVEAMKAGAFTYILKPFNRDELRLTTDQALAAGFLARENRGLRTLLRRSTARPALVYESDAMKRVVDRIQSTAPTDASVLITGESGTGKELVARALHDLSPRWDHPFVPVNCGAIPPDLMESELFGHAKGAFTGAAKAALGRIRKADRGTLFLDEIGELPLALQPKLLRVLETKNVDPVGDVRSHASDFRLVCATNRSLPEAIAAGAFREDLYYRIEIAHLAIPPLRDRLDDVPVLWGHFSILHAGREIETEADVLDRLRGMPWRGNVRELKNMNQRAVMLCPGTVITAAVLDEALAMSAAGPGASAVEGRILGALPADSMSLPDREKEVIPRALAKFGGNKSRTAVSLGIPRPVLVSRLQKYELDK